MGLLIFAGPFQTAVADETDEFDDNAIEIIKQEELPSYDLERGTVEAPLEVKKRSLELESLSNTEVSMMSGCTCSYPGEQPCCDCGCNDDGDNEQLQ